MTQSQQRPPSSNSTNRSAPPMPPPPPASMLSTQRQSTQTIEMPNGSRGSMNPTAHRPGTPPPLAQQIPLFASHPKSQQSFVLDLDFVFAYQWRLVLRYLTQKE